jgi:hypothetical protein
VRAAAPAVATAVVLIVVALLLLPALRTEHRVTEASRLVPVDPPAALAKLARPDTAATAPRARALRSAALVRLGRLRDAERLERANVRARPDDVYALRRLYGLQVLRRERAAARRTAAALRRLDPLFASDSGT